MKNFYAPFYNDCFYSDCSSQNSSSKVLFNVLHIAIHTLNVGLYLPSSMSPIVWRVTPTFLRAHPVIDHVQSGPSLSGYFSLVSPHIIIFFKHFAVYLLAFFKALL